MTAVASWKLYFRLLVISTRLAIGATRASSSTAIQLVKLASPGGRFDKQKRRDPDPNRRVLVA